MVSSFYILNFFDSLSHNNPENKVNITFFLPIIEII